MPKDNTLFIKAHPNLAKIMIDRYGDLDWLNKYSDEKNGRITEYWERNKDGVLVDVTAREKAREELERAKEEYEALRMKELNNVK